MANRERGEGRVVVGDREYTVVCTTNAQCELETHLSTAAREVTTGDVIDAIQRRSKTALRAFLWACLLTHHRAEFPTAEAVGPLMDEAGADYLAGVVAETWKSSQPTAEDLVAAGGPAPAPNPPPRPPRRKGGGGIGPGSIDRQGVPGSPAPSFGG